MPSHFGEFNLIYKAYDKLTKWAAPRGLLNFPETKSFAVYHDDPAITDISKVRQDACITVVGDVKVEEEIGKMTVKGGKYVVGRFEVIAIDIEKCWNSKRQWFAESGYQKEDGNTYELYHYNCSEHPVKYL